ncbi:hypothetical protein COO60DRAFT_1484143 [Scenedesmus sp. NREL 46B-D3]|nr:hypothetical protein COO60DRAFT_1484143 [Scenedesmus sp. NREL 46B-D3]
MRACSLYLIWSSASSLISPANRLLNISQGMAWHGCAVLPRASSAAVQQHACSYAQRPTSFEWWSFCGAMCSAVFECTNGSDTAGLTFLILEVTWASFAIGSSFAGAPRAKASLQEPQ